MNAGLEAVGLDPVAWFSERWTAMFTAMQQLENNLSAIEAAQIEAVTRPTGSKKEPTPPPN